jgi:hypothetical protein
MKKLLLIAITTCLSIGAYAQTNQLNCTEQTFTFKLNLPTGGHRYSSKTGRFDASQIAPEFRLPGANNGKQNQADNMLPISFNKKPDPYTAYYSADTIMFKKMTFLYPKINNVTGKFNRTTYDHFKLSPMPAINTFTPLLN